MLELLLVQGGHSTINASITFNSSVCACKNAHSKAQACEHTQKRMCFDTFSLGGSVLVVVIVVVIILVVIAVVVFV